MKKKKSAAGKIIIFVIELLVLVALLGVLWFVLKGTGNEGVKTIDINESEIEITIPEEVKENETMKGYRNVALFGVDSRTGALSSKTRTDTIMIASINLETSEVKLVSIYRDTYLNQMGNSQNYGKCNAAYAYGGAEQAIKMLNANLDMDITDFMTVGFEGVRDIVDALGGIYISVEEDELAHINNYQSMMVTTMDDISSFTPITETGLQKIDGLQAVAYCRVRYTAGNDFKRTERQREVIKACLDVAKTMSPDALIKICNNVFGEVYTSLDLTEILEILKNITEYSIVDEGGFPTSGKITTGEIGSAGSCVIPVDLSDNVIWLHQFLFDDNEYTPSSNVSTFSDAIYSQTHSYLDGVFNPNADISDDSDE